MANIIFAGTPNFAADILDSLINSLAQTGHTLCAVYTQPDRPAGRGKKLAMSPVKKLALEHNIPLEQPVSLRQQEGIDKLAQYKPDIMLVAAYGLILPKTVLSIPTFGCLNVHASILPKWRGAAPIQHAILAGDTHTGITFMQMEAGLDTGPMLNEYITPIESTDTSALLEKKLIHLACENLIENIELTLNQTKQPITQDDSQASYAPKINKTDAQINWAQPAHAIDRQIRAMYAAPIAFTQLNDTRIKIHQGLMLEKPTNAEPGTIIDITHKGITVACQTDSLLITTLQLPGKTALSDKALLNAIETNKTYQTLFAINNQFSNFPT